MTPRDDLEALLRRDGPGAVARLVEAEAAAGDPDALEMLGQWRLWGIHGPRDLVAGYAATARAADRGSIEATMTRAALLSTGTGVDADPAAARRLVEAAAGRSPLAARQSAILAAPPSSRSPVVLRDDPRVARVDDFLSAAECAYLIERFGSRMRPSTVIDPVSHRPRPHPVRDSWGTNVAPPDEDVVVHAINRRIAAATHTAWEQGEPLHLLRYAPGQQYRPHLDALPGAANQRVLTVLLYLNEEYDGGETAFTGGPVVRGGRGAAVLFANVLPDVTLDPRTEHAGRPVTRGTKWLATRWIRRAPHDPWSR